MNTDDQYRELLASILERVKVSQGRNGTTKRLAGWTCEFDRTPLVSLRRTAWRSALREQEWVLSGSDHLADLHPSVRPWWEPWAEDGRVRYGYGQQLRRWQGRDRVVDQVQELIQGIKTHPGSRRLVATTWHPEDMTRPDCRITNCHGTVVQAIVDDGALTLLTYQRSADCVVGLPVDWFASWAFLLWLCARTDTRPGELVWFGADCHVYQKHWDLASRIAAADAGAAPELVYNPTCEEFRADDFSLPGLYVPTLDEKAEMVV